MGTAEIKYGDSICYIQHVVSGLWLTYQAVDGKCARMGSVQRKVHCCSFCRAFYLFFWGLVVLCGRSWKQLPRTAKCHASFGRICSQMSEINLVY